MLKGLELEKEKEYPLDAKPDGTVILPVNLQGIMEFGSAYRRFKWLYPETYKKYVADCIEGVVFPGSVRMYKEKGQNIILLYYKLYEVGDMKQFETPRLDTQLLTCIHNLFQLDIPGNKVYAPPISYELTIQTIIKQLETHKDFKWIVLGD